MAYAAIRFGKGAMFVRRHDVERIWQSGDA